MRTLGLTTVVVLLVASGEPTGAPVTLDGPTFAQGGSSRLPYAG